MKAAARILILALVAATWSSTGPSTARFRLAQRSAGTELDSSSDITTDAAVLDVAAPSAPSAPGDADSQLSSVPARPVLSHVRTKARPSRSGTRRLVSELTSALARVDLTWTWRLHLLQPDTRGVLLPSSIVPRGPPDSLTHVI